MKELHTEIDEISKKETEILTPNQPIKDEETTIRESAYLLSKQGLSYKCF